MFKLGLQKQRPRPTSYEKHWQKYQCTLGVIQWKPFNVITSRQKESDNIIQMITISKSLSCIKFKYLTESDLGQGKSGSI